MKVITGPEAAREVRVQMNLMTDFSLKGGGIASLAVRDRPEKLAAEWEPVPGANTNSIS